MRIHNSHIVIMRLSALGDVAMTVPVIRALHDKYPDLKITILSKPFHQALFKDLKSIHFIAVDTKNKHQGLFGLWRLFSHLKKENITHFADFHNVLRSKIIYHFFSLTNVKCAKIDKGRKEKKGLLNKINKPQFKIKNTFERYQEVLEKLGFTIDLNQPRFPKKSTTILQKLTLLDDRPLIGFAPFAHYKTKTYPMDLSRKFLELCENETWQILLFGAKNELDKLKTLTEGIDHVKISDNQMSLEDELDLMTNLNLMISMDSANAHLAAMQGVKVITLWGNTHPMLGFYPFNQPIENALLSDEKKYPLIPTSVFGNKKIAGYEEVMRTITPESILNLTKKILANA